MPPRARHDLHPPLLDTHLFAAPDINVTQKFNVVGIESNFVVVGALVIVTVDAASRRLVVAAVRRPVRHCGRHCSALPAALAAAPALALSSSPAIAAAAPPCTSVGAGVLRLNIHESVPVAPGAKR
eukprot:679836-Pyramimonas_sp.AAC.1